MSDDISTGLVFAEAPAVPDFFNVLLYGPTGSGKSTAAASAPGPILWLNAEGPNALAFPRAVARRRGVEIHEVRFSKGHDPRPQMRDVIRHIRSGANPKVRTVVVDTLAKLRELLIARMVVQGSKNSLQQFGDVAKALGGLVTELRDEPVNMVLIAHEDIDNTDNERIVRPLIGGQLTEAIPSDMDVVAYCGAVRDEDQVRYVGQLVEARGRRAKDRSGGLGTARPLDLSEWLTTFQQALGVEEADMPFSEHYQEPVKNEPAETEAAAPVDEPVVDVPDPALVELKRAATAIWTELAGPTKARARVKEARGNAAALQKLIDIGNDTLDEMNARSEDEERAA